MEERRKHGRLDADLRCMVAAVDREGEGRLTDLSRAGVSVIAPSGLAEVGTAMAIALEPDEGVPPLALMGDVVRVTAQGEQSVYGVHLHPLPPAEDEQWCELLKAIAAGRGSGARAHARVHQRVDVLCASQDEFIGTVRDISRGGLSLVCDQGIAVGHVVSISVGTNTLPTLLQLEGRVLWAKPAPDGRLIAGVRFENLDARKLERVKKLMHVLLGLAPREPAAGDGE